MMVRRPLPRVQADAVLNPWCLVQTGRVEYSLFGYVVHHSGTGGLAWLRSTPVQVLDEDMGRARTRSGRRYELGRRFEPEDVAREGDEAAIVFRAFVSGTIERVTMMANPLDYVWVSCCKVARHVGAEPPANDEADIQSFVQAHMKDYFAHRQKWWPR